MGLLNHSTIGRALDVSQNPLPGAKRYIYTAGTDSLAAIYVDPNLTRSVANPTIADASGWFDLCYTMEGSYRVEICDRHGKAVHVEDNITIEPIAALSARQPSFETLSALLEDQIMAYDQAKGRMLVREGELITLSGACYDYVITGENDGTANLTTAGGIGLRVQPRDNERYCTSAFGVGLPGNGIPEDTAALQMAIDHVSLRQGELLIDQTIRYNAELILTQNIRMIGGQTGFTTRLIPQNCPAFVVDGGNATNGDWAFEVKLDDLMFDMSEVTTAQPYAALFRNCYRSHMRRVRFHAGKMNAAAGLTSMIKTEETCNHLIFEDVVAYGQGNTGSGRIFEMRHTKGHLTLFNPDAENAFNGFFFGRNVSVDVYSPYTERLDTAFWFLPAATTDDPHAVNIYGGSSKIPSATSRVLRFDGGIYDKGEKIAIDGLMWQSTNRTTSRTMISTGSFEWRNTHPIALTNLDWSWVNPPPAKVMAAVSCWPNDPFNRIRQHRRRFALYDLASATPTPVFSIAQLETTMPCEPVVVKIRAFAGRVGHATALEEAIWMVQQDGSNPVYLSPKQSITAALSSDDPDEEITGFTLSATSDATKADFAIASTFATVRSSVIECVWFDVEITGMAEFELL